MPLEILPDLPEDKTVYKNEDIPCYHPEHDVPMHMYLAPGRYKWTCPGCGKVQYFEVPHITYGFGGDNSNKGYAQ